MKIHSPIDIHTGRHCPRCVPSRRFLEAQQNFGGGLPSQTTITVFGLRTRQREEGERERGRGKNGRAGKDGREQSSEGQFP